MTKTEQALVNNLYHLTRAKHTWDARIIARLWDYSIKRKLTASESLALDSIAHHYRRRKALKSLHICSDRCTRYEEPKPLRATQLTLFPGVNTPRARQNSRLIDIDDVTML